VYAKFFAQAVEYIANSAVGGLRVLEPEQTGNLDKGQTLGKTQAKQQTITRVKLGQGSGHRKFGVAHERKSFGIGRSIRDFQLRAVGI